jgi:hypothetical protein
LCDGFVDFHPKNQILSRLIRQFNPALKNFIGICAHGFHGIARIDSLAQIRRTDSQIATALAVRELHFAVTSNDTNLLQLVILAYTGIDMQLAFAASRLASDPGAITVSQQALRVWDEIQLDLWSHLQIEDELVFSWDAAHHAISDALLETLKNERQGNAQADNNIARAIAGRGSQADHRRPQWLRENAARVGPDARLARRAL